MKCPTFFLFATFAHLCGNNVLCILVAAEGRAMNLPQKNTAGRGILPAVFERLQVSQRKQIFITAK
jgi:hypothetical protein